MLPVLNPAFEVSLLSGDLAQDVCHIGQALVLAFSSHLVSPIVGELEQIRIGDISQNFHRCQERSQRLGILLEHLVLTEPLQHSMTYQRL